MVRSLRMMPPMPPMPCVSAMIYLMPYFAGISKNWYCRAIQITTVEGRSVSTRSIKVHKCQLNIGNLYQIH